MLEHHRAPLARMTSETSSMMSQEKRSGRDGDKGLRERERESERESTTEIA